MSDADQAPKDADPARSSRAPRASQPPHAPRPWKGAWRVAFAVVWVVTQVALVITADRRPDAAFGFRMFSESSTLKIALHREVMAADGQLARVHVDDGVWSAHDGSGASHRHAWNERVRRQELATFDVEMSAKYSVDAQLARLQSALDDLATHVPDDVDTRRFLLDVTVRKNAREPYVVHLASAERAPRTAGGP